jgi:hypothetical protein
MGVCKKLTPKRATVALAWVVSIGATLIVWPLGAAASPRGAGPTARTAAAAGVVYGGLTNATDRFPVVVEVSKNRKQIVRASAGIRLQCSSGTGGFTIPDSYGKLKVSKTGKFGVSFGPETFRNDDGTTDDVQGSISGAFNAARTKVSGKWQYKLTHHDATGAVVDTCDSGVVSWSAKD